MLYLCGVDFLLGKVISPNPFSLVKKERKLRIGSTGHDFFSEMIQNSCLKLFKKSH